MPPSIQKFIDIIDQLKEKINSEFFPEDEIEYYENELFQLEIALNRFRRPDAYDINRFDDILVYVDRCHDGYDDNYADDDDYDYECEDDIDFLDLKREVDKLKKAINKKARKELINEMYDDFEYGEFLNEKGKNKLSLSPKSYVKRELGLKSKHKY